MGYYNVIASCYVPGKGHYVNLPPQPIELDDDVATPLVESGCLESYPRGRAPLAWLSGATPSDDAPRPISEDEPRSEGAVAIVAPEPAEEPQPRRSRARKRSED